MSAVINILSLHGLTSVPWISKSDFLRVSSCLVRTDYPCPQRLLNSVCTQSELWGIHARPITINRNYFRNYQFHGNWHAKPPNSGEERSKFRIKWWSGFGLVLCAGDGLWHFSHTFAAQPLPCLRSPFVQPYFWTRGARSRTLLPNSPVTAKPRKMWCATRLFHNIITH